MKIGQFVYITVELKAYCSIRHRGKFHLLVVIYISKFTNIVIVIMFTHHIKMSLLSNEPLVGNYCIATLYPDMINNQNNVSVH